jgi:hypothetical protein
MKTLIALSLAALVLAAAPASSFADHARKKTLQIQVTTTNQQVSIKHLRLRATVLVVNQ